jgi:arsenate reductase
VSVRHVAATLALLLSGSLGLAEAPPGGTSSPVVFVCQHGNVKSLMAASYFDRLAKERGLAFRAAARGVDPEAGVPPKIAQALGAEGFDVRSFESTQLSDADLGGATRVVAIGVDLGEVKATVETWNDIPAASADYAAARAALLRRVEQLVAELAGKVEAVEPR